MTTREKVVGMFLGVAIGDSLGRYCEGWTCEEVRSRFGRIEKYIVPDGWPAGRKAGTTTDETQLTIAVAEGLLRSGGRPHIDAQVEAHVTAYHHSTQGWGQTTYEAVRRLANGTPWNLAGARGGRLMGTGTGAIMKLAPTALLLVQRVPGAVEFIADLVSMTHQTGMAVSAGLAHASGLAYCLQADPGSFDAANFVQVVVEASRRGRSNFPETLTAEDITARLGLCHDYADWPPERCVAEFHNGRNYVYDALPYSLMFFLRQPTSVEALYEIVSCGGNADTVGSVVGSLLGALNGTKVFPDHLVYNLEARDQLVEAADRLCEVYKVGGNGHRRLLHVVQADVVEPVGDLGFVISAFLLEGLLVQVGNRQHHYVIGTLVTAPNAAALTDAIGKIEQTQQWELARAMNGDPSGEGVTAFCVWLRQGGFEMVEEQ